MDAPLSSPSGSGTLQQRRDRILDQLASLGDLRPGSLVHRFMRCSTPTCRCHKQGDPGHGPYYVLARNVDGKRTSRSLPASAAAATESQIAEYQRFRRLSAELVEVSERLCDAQLRDRAQDTRSQSKKKPAPSSSLPRSRPKSPAS